MSFSTLARKTIDNENPSHVIGFGDTEIRLYDVSKKGVYGWQKLAVAFNYPNNFEYKTSGCGYCKTSAALDSILSKCGIELHGSNSGNAKDVLRAYHVGGNYYKVSEDAYTLLNNK